MYTSILSPEKDPMGAAIFDYYKHQQADTLRVFSSQFDEDEIPVAQLFRDFEQMSVLEQKALKLAKGHILDVGAGSGCHTLALQAMDKEVTAIDISPLSVEVMQKRGVKQATLINLFDPALTTTYDTLLMLMNGAGIVGVLDNLPLFFTRIKELLRPGGCVLLDSSDLRYLFEEEDGSFLMDLAGDYYGEVDFTMQYKKVKGGSFDWLYVDFETLSHYAAECGFEATLIAEGEHYDYLAQLKLKS
ncbi:MAG: class I SAM-dependent methyltransferase [Phocaeicola sp.]